MQMFLFWFCSTKRMQLSLQGRKKKCLTKCDWESIAVVCFAMEDSLVFHHSDISELALLTNTTSVFALALFVVSWSADCSLLLKLIADLSQHCQERGWKQDQVQFHIFHSDNQLEKLPQDVSFFPTVFFCTGKVDSRTCQKYGSFYNLENLSFLVFSHVLGASPESSIRLPSVDSYDDAISLLKRRSCRFPYQQVAVMVPSRFPSWVDVYKSLFRQLAVKFIYVDFFVFFISKDDMQGEEKKEKNDNHRFHMILSHSCWEEEPKWNAFPVTEAVNVSAWKPSKTFLRWLQIGSPYSPFPPITAETYQHVSDEEEWLHLVVVFHRGDPTVLDYEHRLWEYSLEQRPNRSLAARPSRFYSISYSSFAPFLQDLGVLPPVHRENDTCLSQRAQILVIDRQKQVWMRLPLYLVEDVSLVRTIYSILENLRETSGDVTRKVLQAASSSTTASTKLLHCIHHWTTTTTNISREEQPSLPTIPTQQQQQQPSPLKPLNLFKPNTNPSVGVEIVIFYVPWCIFCQQALPAYSYIAKNVDPSLLRIYPYDCQKYDIPPEWDSWIDGFPTVLIFSSEYPNKPFVYEGPHTVTAIIEYLFTCCLQDKNTMP